MRISWSIGTGLKKYFWKGVWTWLPLGITFYAALWLIGTVEKFVGPLTDMLVRGIVPESLLQGWCQSGHIPGLSLVVTFVFFVLLGWIAHWYLGQRVVALVDWGGNRIPLLKVVYNTLRTIGKNAERTGEGESPVMGKVIRIFEQGMQTLAFVTNTTIQENLEGVPEECYIAVTPFFPSSARVVIVPVAKCREAVMTAGQLAEFVASLGTVLPNEWKKTPSAASAVGPVPADEVQQQPA